MSFYREGDQFEINPKDMSRHQHFLSVCDAPAQKIKSVEILVSSDSYHSKPMVGVSIIKQKLAAFLMSPKPTMSQIQLQWKLSVGHIQ